VTGKRGHPCKGGKKSVRPFDGVTVEVNRKENKGTAGRLKFAIEKKNKGTLGLPFCPEPIREIDGKLPKTRLKKSSCSARLTLTEHKNGVWVQQVRANPAERTNKKSV